MTRKLSGDADPDYEDDFQGEPVKILVDVPQQPAL